VIGMDISPTAVEAAKEGTPFENVSFEVGDFFTLPEEGGFDLIYDYTSVFHLSFTAPCLPELVIDFSWPFAHRCALIGGDR
jgi:Methyltransferase domain